MTEADNVESITLSGDTAYFITAEIDVAGGRADRSRFLKLSIPQLRRLKADIETTLRLHAQRVRDAEARRYENAKAHILKLEAELAEEREFVRKYDASSVLEDLCSQPARGGPK